MGDIRGSDEIPTVQDKERAKEMFLEDDGVNVEKMANHLARLHRKNEFHQETIEIVSDQVKALDDRVSSIEERTTANRHDIKQMKTALVGDDEYNIKGMTHSIKSMRAQIGELHAISVKKATTKTHAKEESALEKDVSKKVYMMWGGLMFAAFLVANFLSDWIGSLITKAFS